MEKIKKERMFKEALFFSIIIFVIGFAAFTAYNLSDSITGFVVYQEGELVSKHGTFALNYNQTCEVELIFQGRDIESDGNITVYISDKDGNSIIGFPKKADMSDYNVYGYKVDISYSLYNSGVLFEDYSIRVSENSEEIFLEDTDKPCPIYCGNDICELGEGYGEQDYCENDCMNSEGDYIDLKSTARNKFFKINNNKDCEAVMQVLDYSSLNEQFDIRLYKNSVVNRYPSSIINKSNINSNGFLVKIYDSKYDSNYYLRYNETLDRVYLYDLEDSCEFECSNLGESVCISNNTYKECTRNSDGYYLLGQESICYQSVCNTEIDPEDPCVEDCEHECETLGELSCYDNETIQECGNFDEDDWCYEWEIVENCDEWYTCSSGACSLGCEDECSRENETTCEFNETSENYYVTTCEYSNDDPCLDLEIIDECLDDYTCEYENETECYCKENWTCTEWSDCEAGKKTRECSDMNSCGTEFEKEEFPEETTCIIQPEINCDEPISFDSWTECREDNTKSRIVYYNSECDVVEEEKIEDCVYENQTQEEVDDLDLNDESNVDSSNSSTDSLESDYISPPHELKAFETESIEEEPVMFEFNIGFMGIILGLIILGGGLGFVYYEVDKSKKSIDKDKKGPINDQRTLQLQNYAKSMISQGYHKDQIKSQLKSQGWDEKQLDKVLDSIEKEQVNQQISNYVNMMKHQGYNDSQIIDYMTKQGWKKSQISSIIKKN